MEVLTEKQQKIYEYIRDHVHEHDVPPTIREVMHKFGLKSPNGAVVHITALVKKGFITKRKGARGICLVDRRCRHCGELNP